MKNKMKKIAALMVATAIILTITVFGRASLQIAATGAYVSATGGGSMSIEFWIEGTNAIDQLGASVVEVYNEDHECVEYFSYKYRDENDEYPYAYFMGYDTGIHTGAVSYDGIAGEKYYAKVHFYAEDHRGRDVTTYITAFERV